MSKYKRLLTATMVAVLLCSLAACGRKNKTVTAEVSVHLGELEQEWQNKREEPAVTIPGKTVSGCVEYTAVRNWVDKDGSPWADIMCQIRNTGDCDMHIRYVDFDLKTTDGKKLRDDSFGIWQKAIAPGECAYLFKTVWLDTPDQIIANIEPQCFYEAADTVMTRFDCSNVSAEKDDDGRILLHITATNNNQTAASNVNFFVVLLDENNHVVFTSSTLCCEGLAARTSDEFTIAFNLPTIYDSWNDVHDYMVMAWEET